MDSWGDIIGGMRRFLTILGLAVCLAATGACLPAPTGREWGRADLRWLEEADATTPVIDPLTGCPCGVNGLPPAADILAVYTHTNEMTQDIRVDLLDINPGDDYHVIFYLRDNRSFSQSPLEIDLSSNGAVHTSSQAQGAPVIWPRVFQNFELDTVTVSINRFLLGNHFHLDVATYTANTQTPVDEAHNVQSDGLPPTVQAPFLLAFWDSFPADTPAQALRRWDGAHTGPMGGRDGLRYLLEAAKQTGIPLTLLDLKNPSSLAGLSYLDVLGTIRSMSENGQLILPEVVYAQPADISLAFSRKAADGFDLPPSPFIYDPHNQVQTGYTGKFTNTLTDNSHISISGGIRFIPSPSYSVDATEGGPSLRVRRALVAALLSPDPADLVVLGGSLPNSTWGQADMAEPTLKWLAGHPWIKPLNSDDLMAFPTVAGKFIFPKAASEPSPLLAELRSAPHNQASELAWQIYLKLNEPTDILNLEAIRANYLSQVNDLLSAAHWAENPVKEEDCSNELQEGGGKGCILSNQSYFAVLEPGGGRLTTLFYKDSAGVHQLIGPTSQFAVGLSDASEWDPHKGEFADPTVIPGAFADARETWTNYIPAVTGSGITFTSPDGKTGQDFPVD